MSAYFLETPCKEPPITDSEFGICDDENGTKAYSNTINREKWVATVKNDGSKEVAFTPIDNCIIILKEGTNDKESTCDGMLTFSNSLFLVELKVQGTGGWRSHAIGQLENTMKLMASDVNIQMIKYKKAYACNRKFPYFQKTDNEENLRFFRKYGFRIHVGAEIIL